MFKVIISILIAFTFSGCALSSTLIAVGSFTSGAAIFAEDVGGIVKVYRDFKKDDNNTK